MTMKLAVVLLRNLSAGWLGTYGNEWVATPNLDRFAAAGIVFERHIAERTDGQSDSYAELGKRFAEFSIRTLNDLVPPWEVPGEVFESYAEEFPERQLVPVTDPAVGPFDRDDLAAWDALRCSYAAVLTRLDAKLGRLFEELREHVVVVTADRGFPLGEHGEVGGSRPHVELVQLPLILRLPDGSGAGERVDLFTQQKELIQSIERAFGFSSVAGNNLCEQSNFWPNVRLQSRPVAITRDAANAALAIRTDEWTCLFPQTAEVTPDCKIVSAKLYAFPEDRREQNDLADRLPERVEELTELAVRADDYSNSDG